MRKMISLGKLGKNGGALLRIGEHAFTYQGAPSVLVSFEVEADKVLSMLIKEPGFEIKALKVK